MFARAMMSFLAAIGGGVGLYLASLIAWLPFAASIAILRSIGQLVAAAGLIVLVSLLWFVTGHVLDIETNWRRALMVAGMAAPSVGVAIAIVAGHRLDFESDTGRALVLVSLLGYVIFGIACGIRYWQTHPPVGEGPTTWRIRAPTDTV